MKKIAEDSSRDEKPDKLRAAALTSLAMDAEWRLGDFFLALSYTDSALNVPEIPVGLRKELERRRARLEEKNENARD